MPATAKDAKVAKALANGFGIKDKDILFLENKNKKQIDAELNKIKREFRELSRKNKRTFLYVYAAGHGAADQM